MDVKTLSWLRPSGPDLIIGSRVRQKVHKAGVKDAFSACSFVVSCVPRRNKSCERQTGLLLLHTEAFGFKFTEANQNTEV